MRPAESAKLTSAACIPAISNITRPPSAVAVRLTGSSQRGFTMVEVAIVLVVVGFIVGGVLKGQEMITNSKLKRIEGDNAGIAAAMLSYQDRHRVIPGDDNLADQRFSLYTDGINDPAPVQINGNGDGVVDGDWMAAPDTETANFWKHLRAAGLVDGDGDDDTQPSNAYGGMIGLRDGSLLISGHAIIFGLIEGPIARVIESRLDDGSPDSGLIQSDLAAGLMNGFAASTAGATYNDTQRYFMAFSM